MAGIQRVDTIQNIYLGWEQEQLAVAIRGRWFFTRFRSGYKNAVMKGGTTPCRNVAVNKLELENKHPWQR